MGRIIKKNQIGLNFIGESYLPKGKKEDYIRNRQLKNTSSFRSLTDPEKEELIKNKNFSDNWNNLLVTDGFNPKSVQNCIFYGLVRIGKLDNAYIQHNDLQLPIGLYNSKIISCDFGDNVSIENVNYLSHYQVGDEVILFNINEITCSSHAKFGNGILKDGEDESVRIWMELCNENGGRSVLPFDGMLSGDAYLWSKYRNDSTLMNRFSEFTQNRYDKSRGYYGAIGSYSTIKHCRIIKDVNIGANAYIKGANKLKNLTINSSETAPTQIGEGVELVNGNIGYGCSIFYGVKAVRFILGNNSNLKYGARLINSFLGDNSTISCCEVLNSLIFPGHEQHHNNSFLCATTVFGQSNVAAGATIGSNHNSRANDGEIVAGRGFWPGLSVSLKHNSKFASYTLLSKGSYPAELNIKIPFCLVINDESNGSLKLIPGFWFLYNMYALARNSWKYRARDNRSHKVQTLEFDYLAPDTINEVLTALELIEQWVIDSSDFEVFDPMLLLNNPNFSKNNRVFAQGIEASKRPVEILKPYEGYHALTDIIILYATKVLVAYCLEEGIKEWISIKEKLSKNNISNWINVGGQLLKEVEVEKIKQAICLGQINSWENLHIQYKRLGAAYPLHKAQHAYTSLSIVMAKRGLKLDKKLFLSSLKKGVEINTELTQRTFDSRNKDYTNPFRKMVYDNEDEMDAVVGKIEDNSFIKHTVEQAKELERNVDQLEFFLTKLKKVERL